MLFVLFLMVIAFVSCSITGYNIPDANLSLNLLINYENNESKQREFLFNLHTTTLEESTETFCQTHNISNKQCRLLYDAAVRTRYQYAEQEMLKLELARNVSIINSQFIPNPHLERTSFAASAELDNHFKDMNQTIALKNRLDFVIEEIFQLLVTTQVNNNLNNKAQQQPLKIAIIHSCSLIEEKSRILTSLLKTFQSTGFLDFVDMVLVLNFGHTLSTSTALSESVSDLHTLLFQHKKVHLFEVSSDTSYFEVPTMLMLSHLSRRLHSSQQQQHHSINAHLLYTHTKGVSYKLIYPQIEDWREYMLYFLVERHIVCDHLLASQAFDALGVNFKTSPRDFRGNFWWTTSDYLSQLPVLDLHEADKYTAEKWMLSGERVRVFNFHESAVDHHKTRYERSAYALSFSSPSDAMEGEEEVFSGYCKGMVLTFKH